MDIKGNTGVRSGDRLDGYQGQEKSQIRRQTRWISRARKELDQGIDMMDIKGKKRVRSGDRLDGYQGQEKSQIRRKEIKEKQEKSHG